MKKPRPRSCWIIRQLEERVVYSGHGDIDLKEIMEKQGYNLSREQDRRDWLSPEDKNQRSTLEEEQNGSEELTVIKTDVSKNNIEEIASLTLREPPDVKNLEEWVFDSEEEWREWESLTTKKRSERILQSLEESEEQQEKLKQLSEEQCTKTEKPPQERREFLKMPTEEELESINEMLFSEEEPFSKI